MDHAIRVYGYFVITKNNLASFSLEIVYYNDKYVRVYGHFCDTKERDFVANDS